MGEMHQGYYFGLMQGLFSVGTSGTGMIVGPLAEVEYDIPGLGVQRGWCIAFAIVSSFAIVASFLALSIMPEVPAPVLTEEQKQQPGENDGGGDPDHAQVPEVPELCPDDSSGYFWIHPMASVGEPQLVRKTLWVRAVDIVLAWVPWSVWRGGWFHRWPRVRFPRHEDRMSGSPSDGHVDCRLRHSSPVHVVVWDCPGLSSQHGVGFLHDSGVLQPTCELGTAWLQFSGSWTDCNGEGSEQGDVLGDGI